MLADGDVCRSLIAGVLLVIHWTIGASIDPEPAWSWLLAATACVIAGWHPFETSIKQVVARTLDIDVIAFANVRMDDARLVLPHPRAHERAFVLAPLAEIAPALVLHGRRVDALAATVDRAGMSVDAAATRIVLR